MPIVVTDDEGESPMVLVSLEELEAILDGNDRSAPPPDLEPIMYPSVKKEETRAPNFLDGHDFTTQGSVDSDEVPFFEEETLPVEGRIAEPSSEFTTQQTETFPDPQTFLTELAPSIELDTSEESGSSAPRAEDGGRVADQEIFTLEPLQAPSTETKSNNGERGEELSLEEQFYLDHG